MHKSTIGYNHRAPLTVNLLTADIARLRFLGLAINYNIRGYI